MVVGAIVYDGDHKDCVIPSRVTLYFLMYWLVGLPWVMVAMCFIWSIFSLCMFIIDFGTRLTDALRSFDATAISTHERSAFSQLNSEWHVLLKTASDLSYTWAPLTCITFLVGSAFLLLNVIIALENRPNNLLDLWLSAIIAVGMILALFLLALPHSTAERAREAAISNTHFKLLSKDVEQCPSKSSSPSHLGPDFKSNVCSVDESLEDVKRLLKDNPLFMSLAGHSITLKRVGTIFVGLLTLFVSFLALQGLRL
eukprot:ANDGO_00699.mRNA.1 hypothetical protein